MRSATCLVALAALAAARADDIPQDAAKRDARRAARLAYYRGVTVEAYQKVGDKSPKWDKAVEKELEILARALAFPEMPAGKDEGEKVMSAQIAVSRVVDANRRMLCTDPLHFAVAHLVPSDFLPEKDDPGEYLQQLQAAEAMAKNPRYPPATAARVYALGARATAMLRFVEPALQRGKPNRFYELAVAQFPAMLATPSREAREDVYDVFEWLAVAHAAEKKETKSLLDLALKKLADLKDEEALRQLLTGAQKTMAAWDGQVSVARKRITRHGRNVSAPRLKEAEAALKKSWELDPTGPWAAVNMLHVARGLGYPREAMEEWFRRAMDLDPDCYAACAGKVEYLSPRGKGNELTAREFALDCYRTENWQGGLPMMLLWHHEAMGGMNPAHFRKPDVWSDLEMLFDALLKDAPRSAYGRTLYAMFAARCGQIKAAHKLFEELGDDPYRPLFTSWDQYEKVRADTRRRAGAPPAPKR